MINSAVNQNATLTHFRLWVIITIGLFIIGLVAGLLIAITMPAGIVGILSDELSALEELGTILGPFQATTAIFIYLKNATALLFSFVFSPILCLLPFLTLTLNGLMISLISLFVLQQESLGFLLAGLLPHGIFEIPALIIGEAAALRFGAMAIIALISKDRRKLLLPCFKQNLRYLLLALVMLIPAAIIEIYVTPLFMQ